MDVSVVLKLLPGLSDAKPGMCVVYQRPGNEPTVALVVEPRQEGGAVDVLPICPAMQNWSRTLGRQAAENGLSVIEGAIIRPIQELPSRGLPSYDHFPPGALVMTDSGFLIAGRPLTGMEAYRPGYDPATGKILPLEGMCWFNDWAVFVPDITGLGLRKICECHAEAQQSGQ